MLKKLLVAVLALTIFIGLFSPALANEATRPLEGRQLAVPEAAPDDPARLDPFCYRENYATTGYLYYLFALPDAYGDDYFNMRFTNETPCTLTQARVYLRGPAASGGSTVGVGVTVYLWNSQPSGFPNLGSVIYSIPVNPVFPAATGSIRLTLNLRTAIPGTVFQGNFNLGISPIADPGEFLVTGMDQNGTGGGRSSEWYPPNNWGTMAGDWGVDGAFLFDVDKCCAPEPTLCTPTPDPTDQWPIWCHDFGRSSQSGITLGTSVCGITNVWMYDPGPTPLLQLARTGPLIVNDRVYVFYGDRVVCLNLLTGAVVWNSITFTGVAPFHWALAVSGLASDPAIEGGYLYMGTGAAVAGGPAGYMKIDAATGALVWGRGAGLGPNLEGPNGNTTVSPPVIIGPQVYFGNQTGVLYALDKVSGATMYFTVLPQEAGASAKMLGSLSSDGTNLFVGTCNAVATPVAAGRVYSFLPGVGLAAGFVQNWVYNQPAAVQAAYPGGFWSAPSYRSDNLFIQSVAAYNTGTGYCGYRQNLNPATGVEKWFTNVAMGAARNAPPATICTTTGVAAVFSNYITAGYSGQTAARGLRAVQQANVSVWTNPGNTDGYENHVYCAPAITQDPWVFYGGNDPYGQNELHPVGGNWKIVNGTTGVTAVQYAFTGYVQGTAIARGSDLNNYIVVVTQFSAIPDPITGSGRVFAFRDLGPRPRLVVPSNFVIFPSTNDDEAAPVQRTAANAIRNTGCATLNYTTTLESAPLFAKVRTVSLAEERVAENLANSLIDYTVEDVVPYSEPVGSKFLQNSLVQNEEGDWYLPAKEQIKPAMANSARLAPPTWATWVSGSAGAVAAGTGANFTFQFDRSLMAKLGVNVFYVEVSTDDPDFNPEQVPLSPQGVQSEIGYSMPYMYCATDIVEGLYFGDLGVMWANNIGLLGHPDMADEFAPHGAGDVLFSGSLFYANDMPSAAWNPIAGDGSWDPVADGGFLYGFYVSGTDCGGCLSAQTFPVAETPDGGASYSWVVGDICTFAMVDSGQDMGYWSHQNGPSLGLLIKSKEIGAYGPSVNANTEYDYFKLTVQTIINRSAINPVNGLYYGAFVDWDVSTASDVGIGDAAKGYIYQYGDGSAYGFIGLPSMGSYWPDGTPGDPMYNGTILHSSDDYWDNEQFDSLYAWVDKNAEGNIHIRPAETPGTDRAMELAFGKVSLAGSGEHMFGFATFGLDGIYTGPTQVDNLRKFVNKFAGFGRGDVNNDNIINLADMVRLAKWVAGVPGALGPVPFRHLADVNNDGLQDGADVTYLAAYFFSGGPPPKSTFLF